MIHTVFCAVFLTVPGERISQGNDEYVRRRRQNFARIWMDGARYGRERSGWALLNGGREKIHSHSTGTTSPFHSALEDALLQKNTRFPSCVQNYRSLWPYRSYQQANAYISPLSAYENIIEKPAHASKRISQRREIGTPRGVCLNSTVVFLNNGGETPETLLPAIRGTTRL